MGALVGKKCYQYEAETRSRSSKKTEKSRRVKKTGKKKLADELHASIRRNFTRRRVIVNHIDEIWASDLVEMQQFSKWNKGYRYLLMVIDVFQQIRLDCPH